MKKIIIFFLFTLLVISCKDKYNSNLDKMTSDSKQYIEDFYFKRNETLNILEFKPIRYDSINESHIDSVRLLNNVKLIEYYLTMSEKSGDIARLSQQQALLYSEADFGSTLVNIQKDDAKKALKESRLYLDSASQVIKQDSIIRHKLSNLKDTKTIYQYFFFIKATVKSRSGDTENIMDTISIYFNPDLTIRRTL
nr:hypothetical protein [uncultured Bacteroides sp.]